MFKYVRKLMQFSANSVADAIVMWFRIRKMNRDLVYYRKNGKNRKYGCAIILS